LRSISRCNSEQSLVSIGTESQQSYGQYSSGSSRREPTQQYREPRSSSSQRQSNPSITNWIDNVDQSSSGNRSRIEKYTRQNNPGRQIRDTDSEDSQSNASWQASKRAIQGSTALKGIGNGLSRQGSFSSSSIEWNANGKSLSRHGSFSSIEWKDDGCSVSRRDSFSCIDLKANEKKSRRRYTSSESLDIQLARNFKSDSISRGSPSPLLNACSPIRTKNTNGLIEDSRKNRNRQSIQPNSGRREGSSKKNSETNHYDHPRRENLYETFSDDSYVSKRQSERYMYMSKGARPKLPTPLTTEAEVHERSSSRNQPIRRSSRQHVVWFES